MGDNSGKTGKIFAIISIAIIIAFLVSIAITVFSEQFFVKKYGINNAFINFVLSESKVDIFNNLIREDLDFNTDFVSLYPFENPTTIDSTGGGSGDILRKYTTMVNLFEDKFQNYLKKRIWGINDITSIQKKYNNLLQFKWRYAAPGSIGELIYMNNGYLTSSAPYIKDDNLNDVINSIVDFKNFLMSYEIPMYYVNVGSKVNPKDKQLSEIDLPLEQTNENADRLLFGLNKLGVNTIDMREEILNKESNWYDNYYKTDHHWKPEIQLFGAKIVAKSLNENSGFNYDLSKFNSDSYEYRVYKNAMFGDSGRRATFADAVPEDYTRILPRFQTNFTVEIPTKKILATGAFDEVLIAKDYSEEVSRFSESEHLSKLDAYSSVTCQNDPLSIIRNNMDISNKDKKLLILQDSNGWYFSNFLECDTGEVRRIYPNEFEGSIRSFVKEYKPDAVILLFGSGSIQEIDWSGHRSMLDFR